MDDIAALIANTLVTKGGEAIVSAGAGAVRALVALVRRRFGREGAEAEALEDAVGGPDDEARRQHLAEVLAEAMRRDPVFAREVRALWQTASVE